MHLANKGPSPNCGKFLNIKLNCHFCDLAIIHHFFILFIFLMEISTAKAKPQQGQATTHIHTITHKPIKSTRITSKYDIKSVLFVYWVEFYFVRLICWSIFQILTFDFTDDLPFCCCVPHNLLFHLQ